MRIMAVDYGDVRTGVALSDITGTLAGDARTLTLTGKALVNAIAELAQSENAGTVVVGCPRNMDGSYGPRAMKTIDFTEKLKNRGLPVVLRDERLTTVSAHAILNAQN